MRTVVVALFVLICFFYISGCESGGILGENSEREEDRPVAAAKFKIVQTERGMTDFGAPRMRVIVKNTGGRTGYNVACDVHAKDAGGTIIDSGFAYFANGGNIKPGEKARDDAVFFKLDSFNQVGKFTFDLTWLDR